MTIHAGRRRCLWLVSLNGVRTSGMHRTPGIGAEDFVHRQAPHDPGHSGIIKPPRPGQGGCSSSSWCPVTAMPSRICAVNQPT